MCRTSTHHSTRGGSPSAPPPPPPTAAVGVPTRLERGRSKPRFGPPVADDGENMIAVFLLVATAAADDDAVPWDRGSCTNAVVARPRRSTDTVAIAAGKPIFAGEDVYIRALRALPLSHLRRSRESSQQSGENKNKRFNFQFLQGFQ